MNAQIKRTREAIIELDAALKELEKLLPETRVWFVQKYTRGDGEMFRDVIKIAMELDLKFMSLKLRALALSKLNDEDLEILGIEK